MVESKYWVGLEKDMVLFLEANCLLNLKMCMVCMPGVQFWPLGYRKVKKFNEIFNSFP
jgi:hypothetical protein